MCLLVCLFVCEISSRKRRNKEYPHRKEKEQRHVQRFDFAWRPGSGRLETACFPSTKHGEGGWRKKSTAALRNSGLASTATSLAGYPKVQRFQRSCIYLGSCKKLQHSGQKVFCCSPVEVAQGLQATILTRSVSDTTSFECSFLFSAEIENRNFTLRSGAGTATNIESPPNERTKARPQHGNLELQKRYSTVASLYFSGRRPRKKSTRSEFNTYTYIYIYIAILPHLYESKGSCSRM